MNLQIKFRVDDKSVKDILRIYSGDTNHSSHKGFQGYIYIYIYILLVVSFPIYLKDSWIYDFAKDNEHIGTRNRDEFWCRK